MLTWGQKKRHFNPNKLVKPVKVKSSHKRLKSPTNSEKTLKPQVNLSRKETMILLPMLGSTALSQTERIKLKVPLGKPKKPTQSRRQPKEV